jgi:ATP synthase F1 delta subunit
MSAPEVSFARALFDATKELAKTEEERITLLTRLSGELQAAQEVLGQYSTVFYNPSVSSKHIVSLLSVFEGEISGLGYQFLCLLAIRRKMKYLPRIVPRFIKLSQQASGKVRVKLSLPYSPSEKLLLKLRESLAAFGLYSQRSTALAEFDVSVDKSLVGGFIAECDGLLLDHSLRTRLMHISKA